MQRRTKQIKGIGKRGGGIRNHSDFCARRRDVLGGQKREFKIGILKDILPEFIFDGNICNVQIIKGERESSKRGKKKERGGRRGRGEVGGSFGYDITCSFYTTKWVEVVLNQLMKNFLLPPGIKN